MNRRSFLQFLGVAPVVAPAALAAMPEPTVAASFRNCLGLPEISFRAVNAEYYGRSEILDALPMMRARDAMMRSLLAFDNDELD